MDGYVFVKKIRSCPEYAVRNEQTWHFIILTVKKILQPCFDTILSATLQHVEQKFNGGMDKDVKSL